MIPGCSSRILILIFYPSPGSRIRNTLLKTFFFVSGEQGDQEEGGGRVATAGETGGPVRLWPPRGRRQPGTQAPIQGIRYVSLNHGLDPDLPDPHVFGPSWSISQVWIRIRILYHQAKIIITLIPTVLRVLLLDFNFLSLKSDVNVSSKSNKQKISFCVGVLKVDDENSRIRIH